MAPFKSIRTGESSRDVLSASSRPNLNSKTGPRVVKNKATSLAIQGSAPWDDDQRQQLIDYHTSSKTWDDVAKMLNRSNQAIRLEWKKMRDGHREIKGGQWQRKAKSTAVKPTGAGEPAKDSSSTPRSTASTSRSPTAETSSNTTLSGSPCGVPGFQRPGTTMMVLEDPFRRYKNAPNDEWHEKELMFSEVPQKMPFRVDLEYKISFSHKRTDSSEKEIRLGMVRREIADGIKYNTTIDITDTDMTGMDQFDTGDDDVVAEEMRYQSLGSETERKKPHESKMLFKGMEAWVRTRGGRVAYQHPWGFQGNSRGKGHLFDDVDLVHSLQIAKSCTGYSKKEIDADLRAMGIGR
ncbi:hypothetical protein QM012_009531 [Aureobasidium pullulans]|uniref:Myb-like domain-containing protein n=1 Tax=Aureobasidium pullulans TaxID=5580 RepID=A0ABR0TIG6_AURPU